MMPTLTLLKRQVAALVPLSGDPCIPVKFPHMKPQADAVFDALAGKGHSYKTIYNLTRKRQDRQKYQRQYIRAQMFTYECKANMSDSLEVRLTGFYAKKKWHVGDIKKVTNFIHQQLCMIY